MPEFTNPFRPGAGHMPPYLAGRDSERQEFARLLQQEVILENPIITGLRGVGKTVLLETFKPQARAAKWLWVGADLSESASITETNLATRLIADVALASSSFDYPIESQSGTDERKLDYMNLIEVWDKTPGLVTDKLKTVLELVHEYMPDDYQGIVFAYDEAQNLSDHASRDEYPLSVLLEVFRSLQRKDIPFMLLLTGLPTLFPKLVEARTYAERMFRVLFLERLSEEESEKAIRVPIEEANCPIVFRDESIRLIQEVSGGYPYFIQFVCREIYDIYIERSRRGDAEFSAPVQAILKKLDTDFFAGRWSRATDRQRELLWLVANLPSSDSEFSVQEIVAASSSDSNIKNFSSSHVNQMLSTLSDNGLVFKNRHGRYSFAVPLLADFIKRNELR